MFKYGKKESTMAVVALVLSLVPILIVGAFLPQMGDQVAMKFDAAGEVARWGSKYELLMAPVFALALGVGNLIAGLRRAQEIEKNDKLMARITFGRSARNALVTSALLLIASIYLLQAALTGHGIGF